MEGNAKIFGCFAARYRCILDKFNERQVHFRQVHHLSGPLIHLRVNIGGEVAAQRSMLDRGMVVNEALGVEKDISGIKWNLPDCKTKSLRRRLHLLLPSQQARKINVTHRNLRN